MTMVQNFGKYNRLMMVHDYHNRLTIAMVNDYDKLYKMRSNIIIVAILQWSDNGYY